MSTVGHDTTSGSAAIRAGVSMFEEVEGFVSPKGGKCVGSVLSGVTDGKNGVDRLLPIAIPAAKEALFSSQEFSRDVDPGSAQVILSLPSPERLDVKSISKELLPSLLGAIEWKSLESSAVIANQDGHSGGIIALRKGMTLLQERKVKTCLVGGMDSLVDYPSLLWLERKKRLKTDRRPHGFNPGEAAAFLVLELESTARERGAALLGEVVVTSVTQESAHLSSNEPLRGLGLTLSIREVLNLADQRNLSIAGMLCDLNGEYYRMKEWSLAMTHVFNGSDVVPPLWHPAEHVGDVGAASAVVNVVLAVDWLNRRVVNGSNMLIWTSSDNGSRGTALISRVGEA